MNNLQITNLLTLQITNRTCISNTSFIRYQSSYTIRVNERTHSKHTNTASRFDIRVSLHSRQTLNLTRCCINMSNNLENFIIDLKQWNNTKNTNLLLIDLLVIIVGEHEPAAEKKNKAQTQTTNHTNTTPPF